VGLGISTSACGQCLACACVFVRICMRIRMYVGINICAFFCGECYRHFTGVLGTSTWAGEYHPKTVIEMWITCLDPVSANSEKYIGSQWAVRVGQRLQSRFGKSGATRKLGL